MKTLFFCLLAVLLAKTADVGQACEYCRLAAEDPEAARLALAAHASTGTFPLQAAINQFKGDAPPAVLSAPPTANSVTTSAADLPPSARRATPPAFPAPAAPVTAPLPPPAPAHPVTWADAGLLGLFGLLGFFGWRTRRTSGSVN